MREAVIVSAARTAVGKAPRGTLRRTRPDEMGAVAVKEAIARAKGLDPAEIDDIVLGCAFPEAEQGMNVARIVALRVGLPTSVCGQTVNRFCSSGLQAIAIGAQSIMCGWADVVVAGGVESMSLVPMGGNQMRPNPYLIENFPEVYLGMGLTAEEVAERFGVSREDQDLFAYESHMKAAEAIREGRFKDEIVPLTVKVQEFDDDGGLVTKEVVFDTDEGVRPDTNPEVLSKLRPVFKQNGTVTAGNSSQTSDGAAAVVLMSAEKASALGLEPMAVFRSFAVGGVDPDIMGVGPVEAVPKALKYAGVKLDDIELIELNEAFAAQSLAVIRKLGLNKDIVNVNGGAVALGHPLGCTGAKLTVTILHEMARRKARYGLVTMCIGGGMGAAGVLERAR
ncbi:MAG TPA: acetyl-CoA C-acyltransferase [Clostridiales bacterium]|nr:acetyl-CoA C-acyltransferase [Clostridiales bacterium]